jgi:N-acetylglucosamine-6-phosphate deacetylase
MSTLKCTGVHAFSGDPVEVRFGSGGVIQAVDELVDPLVPPPFMQLAPGFIDLQVNGFAGADYNSPDTAHEVIAHSLRAQFACGVTRLFPTVITGSEERITGSLRNLVKARATLVEGPAMEAFHVEGPHISPEDGPRGAHPARWVRKPDIEEYKRWQDAAEGLVRLITIAAEWPEAPRYIEHVRGDGVVVSIGHTNSTGAQIRDCVAAGATMSTHLGNGAHAVMSRHPNYIWEQLAEDRLSPSFIADGIHVGEAFLKSCVRAKGVSNSVLVTDAVMPAGCEPGPYELGEVEVELLPPGDRVVMRGGTRLAGSALHMHDAVANVMKMTGVSLRDAITMVTINPARVGRVGGRMRGLAVGDRADFVRFDVREGRLRVLDTWLGGKQVYSSGMGSA